MKLAYKRRKLVPGDFKKDKKRKIERLKDLKISMWIFRHIKENCFFKVLQVVDPVPFSFLKPDIVGIGKIFHFFCIFIASFSIAQLNA